MFAHHKEDVLFVEVGIKVRRLLDDAKRIPCPNFSRHGQSAYNAIGKIGGDSDLTPEGNAYAQRLAEFTEKVITRNEAGEEIPARLWTSTMKRTCQTAQYIEHPVRSFAWSDDDLGGCVAWRGWVWPNLAESGSVSPDQTVKHFMGRLNPSFGLTRDTPTYCAGGTRTG